MTEFDGLDGRLVPIEFVAVTVNVTVAPIPSPDTTIGLVDPVAV